VTIVNAILGRLVDGLLYPFEGAPLAGLAAMSLLTSVATLVAFRATSDQGRLVAVKRAIQACWFEIRLFNDDIRAMLRAQAEMIGHYLVYLRLALLPALWIGVPLGFFVIQLHSYYAYSGLVPGHAALIKVRLKQAVPEVPLLEAPAGIRIETPAARIASLNEVVWRIVAEQPGNYELTVRLGDARFTKNLRVSSDVVRRSPLRTDGTLISQLVYPSESPLPDEAPLESIAVTYPPGEVTILGKPVSWLFLFVGLSTVFVFALRKRLGVVI